MEERDCAATVAYGMWPSPLSASQLTNRTIDDVQCDGDDIYWVEALPGNDGYLSLMRCDKDGAISEALPNTCDNGCTYVGTKVYEYGGLAYAVRNGLIVFSSALSGQVHLWDGTTMRALTPVNDNWRFADFAWHPFNDTVYCVMEDHTGATEPHQVKHSLVGISTDGSIETIFDEADFVSSPAISKDGRFLAFISWDAPAMPWTYTRLHVTKIRHRPREIHTIIDAPNVAVCHPVWTEDGDLLHIDDSTGWDSVYKTEGFVRPHHGDNPHLNWFHRMRTRALNPAPSDFAPLLWTLGRRSLAVFDSDYIFATWLENGMRRCGMIRLDNGEREIMPIEWQVSATMDCANGRCVFVGYNDTNAPALVSITGGKVKVLRRSVDVPLPEQSISTPQYMVWPTSDGSEARGFYYAPKLDGVCGPSDAKPPLIVFVHGGPTSMATTARFMDYMFWTTRGFGVLVVNYRGSTGFGREYQDALNGWWGIRDVSDCEDGARHLIKLGLADPKRIAIRGGSAGGFTTLSALTQSDVFSAGCSLYGVADLRLLDAQTHKFEADYLPALIGATGPDDAVWDERAPINHVDSIHAPLLLLQGDSDKIVPPNQAELIAKSLQERGCDVEMHIFPGEAHGFVHDEARAAAANYELEFYRRVWALDK